MTKPTDLVSFGEIAKMADMSLPAVANWVQRYDDFPKPWGQWGIRFKLYKKDEVEAWLAKREAYKQLSKDAEIDRLKARIAELEGR